MTNPPVLTPPAPLNTYLTWCLGQDFGGLALIYASSFEEAFALLDWYVAGAQPRHRLFAQPLQYELLHYRPNCVSSRHTDSSRYGHHLYHIGEARDETRPRVLLLESGEDLRFND